MSESEFRWTHCHSVDEMEAFYRSIIEPMRAAARAHGYALGVHGSMRRDLDLIAAPWREGCSDKDTLAGAIHIAACGLRMETYRWTQKPLGRWAVSMPVCWAEWEGCYGIKGLGHVDLSVMPS